MRDTPIKVSRLPEAVVTYGEPGDSHALVAKYTLKRWDFLMSSAGVESEDVIAFLLIRHSKISFLATTYPLVFLYL